VAAASTLSPSNQRIPRGQAFLLPASNVYPFPTSLYTYPTFTRFQASFLSYLLFFKKLKPTFAIAFEKQQNLLQSKHLAR